MAKRILHIVDFIRRIIYYEAIAFIVVALFSLTIAQYFPYEFKDPSVVVSFYNVIMGGTPLAILFTLFGTIRHGYSIARNSFTILMTVCSAILGFIVLMRVLLFVDLAIWSDDKILYRHRTFVDTTIRKQVHGILGEGGTRIVILQPVLFYWNKVTEVDTALIKKEEWVAVDEEHQNINN